MMGMYQGTAGQYNLQYHYGTETISTGYTYGNGPVYPTGFDRATYDSVSKFRRDLEEYIEWCSYRACALPRRPPPISLELSTRPLPALIEMPGVGSRTLWFRKRQSCPRQTVPSRTRRKKRTWESGYVSKPRAKCDPKAGKWCLLLTTAVPKFEKEGINIANYFDDNEWRPKLQYKQPGTKASPTLLSYCPFCGVDLVGEERAYSAARKLIEWYASKENNEVVEALGESAISLDDGKRANKFLEKYK